MKKQLLTLFSLFVCLSAVSQNKMIVNADISEVTLYTASANILYTRKLSLKQGKNIILFTDLTPYIVENSINVGVSDKSVNIITVTEKINHLKTIKKRDVSMLNDSINNITDELGIISGQIEVYEKEKSLLFKDESIGGVSKGVAVSEIEKASDFFFKRYSRLNEELFKLNKRKTKLLAKNEKLKLQVKEISATTQKAVSEIILEVYSPSAREVDVNIKLLTSNAGWAPLYDLKYEEPGKDLEFIFRANVFNATDIDWKDVKIILSTASPSHGFDLPSLSDASSNKKTELNYQNQNIKFRQIQTTNIIAEYKIDFNYSIPSDGKPYLVDVDKFSIPSEYSYIVIPKLENSGFLMADIPNWNKYNLLSGTTNIYRKNAFMGKTFLNTITDNDTLNVYLGKDNNIKTYRKETNDEFLRKIIGNYYVEKAKIEITIKNEYRDNVKIKLIDQVPVYEVRDRVKMNITNIESAIYNKSDGILNWFFNLAPGENRIFNFSYTVKAPKNLDVRILKRKAGRVTIPCPDF